MTEEALQPNDRRQYKPTFTHYPGNCLHCYCGNAVINGIPHRTCCMCGTRCKTEEIKR